MSIVKVIELMADSTESWEDATKKAIAKAAETLSNIKSAWVQDQSVTVKNGKVEEFRVSLKVTFEVR
ncbi:MAG TPA: dodecin family protein [Saprospiraceae bacterium]|nr:dodecin family protein [Saprospiraceae bacterium]